MDAEDETELTRLVEGRCVDVLQVDIARVGLTQAMRVAKLAAAEGIPCVNHSYSYGINLAASLHFAAAIESTSLFEFQATPNEIRDVLVPDVPRPVDGMLEVPQGPGHLMRRHRLLRERCRRKWSEARLHGMLSA